MTAQARSSSSSPTPPSRSRWPPASARRGTDQRGGRRAPPRPSWRSPRGGPDLVVVRAELPDLSGFSLCARLRHDRATARLPVILYSSRHARRPRWPSTPAPPGRPAATWPCRSTPRRSPPWRAACWPRPEPIELADDAIVEERRGGRGGGARRRLRRRSPAPAAALRRPRGAAPSRCRRACPGRAAPRRPHRGGPALRRAGLPVDRAIGATSWPPRPSGAARRRAAISSATPEGRLSLLREDLKWREAQLARLGELWEVREREVAELRRAGPRQGVDVPSAARPRPRRLRRRLAAGPAPACEEKDREPTAPRWRGCSSRSSRTRRSSSRWWPPPSGGSTSRAASCAPARRRGRPGRRSWSRPWPADRGAGGRGAGGARPQVAALEGQVDGLDRALREAAERIGRAGRARSRRATSCCAAARREVDRLQGELSAARQALMLRETELRSEIGRARSEADEVSAALAQAVRERDASSARADGLALDLAASREQGRVLAADLEAARSRPSAEVPEWIAEAAAATPGAEPAPAPAVEPSAEPTRPWTRAAAPDPHPVPVATRPRPRRRPPPPRLAPAPSRPPDAPAHAGDPPQRAPGGSAARVHHQAGWRLGRPLRRAQPRRPGRRRPGGGGGELAAARGGHRPRLRPGPAGPRGAGGGRRTAPVGALRGGRRGGLRRIRRWPPAWRWPTASPSCSPPADGRAVAAVHAGWRGTLGADRRGRGPGPRRGGRPAAVGAAGGGRPVHRPLLLRGLGRTWPPGSRRRSARRWSAPGGAARASTSGGPTGSCWRGPGWGPSRCWAAAPPARPGLFFSHRRDGGRTGRMVGFAAPRSISCGRSQP